MERVDPSTYGEHAIICLRATHTIYAQPCTRSIEHAYAHARTRARAPRELTSSR